MRFVRYFLFTTVSLWLSCILEPHEMVKEIGICYRGNDHYKQLLQDDVERIELLGDLPDTLYVPPTETEMEIAFVCHTDTAYFTCGNYSIGIRCKGTVFSFPEYMQNPDDTLPLNNKRYFPHFWVGTSMKAVTVYGTADTFSAKISYQQKESQMFFESNDTVYQETDTGTIWLEFYSERYVDGSYCSEDEIFTTKPIEVTLRKPDE